ncbi:MAG TPA: hypothetical protein VIH90_00800 [Candidatus Saccharimonadales bacterium]
MPIADVQAELVNATPVLWGVIESASDSPVPPDTDLTTEIHGVVADVAVAAYKAGVMAMSKASRFYEDPEDAADRLVLRADLATIDLHDRGRWTTHTAEVTELIDSSPSYLPFDPAKCTPPEGFTHEHRKNWGLMVDGLLANFNLCDTKAFEAIAAEMGYRFHSHLKSEGVEGVDLLNRVKAFEVKQVLIMQAAVSSGTFRQPDQDDHAYEHYLEDLSIACVPVWKAMTSSRRSR